MAKTPPTNSPYTISASINNNNNFSFSSNPPVRMNVIADPCTDKPIAALDAPLVIRDSRNRPVHIAEELERLDYMLQRLMPQQYDEINQQWKALRDIERKPW